MFAKGLFTAMIPHEKKFFMQSHVLLAENDELLLLAAKAGCIGVFVGIESVSADTLSEANKGFHRFCMQSHVLLAENDELLLLAAKAGCIGVFVGIESVSADTLSEANKGFNR